MVGPLFIASGQFLWFIALAVGMRRLVAHNIPRLIFALFIALGSVPNVWAIGPGDFPPSSASLPITITIVATSSRSAWFNQYAYCDGDPVNREDPSGLKWVLRVSPNGKDEVVWQPEDDDLAPSDRYEVDPEYLAWIKSGKRSLFSMETSALHAAQEEAWRSGKIVDIPLRQSVNAWYFDSFVNPKILAWEAAEVSSILDSSNGTFLQKRADAARIHLIADQLRVTAKGGMGQGALDVYKAAVGINVGFIDAGTPTGAASIQYQNGEIDTLQMAAVTLSDGGQALAYPLMFVPGVAPARGALSRAAPLESAAGGASAKVTSYHDFMAQAQAQLQASRRTTHEFAAMGKREKPPLVLGDWEMQGARLQSVKLSDLHPHPSGRQFADPGKLSAMGPFNPDLYAPIWVKRDASGVLRVENGMTRLQAAMLAGYEELPVFIFGR